MSDEIFTRLRPCSKRTPSTSRALRLGPGPAAAAIASDRPVPRPSARWCVRSLDAFMAELKSAGHEASTRDHTEREDAYPSVALSFTPRGAPRLGTDVQVRPQAGASSCIARSSPPRPESRGTGTGPHGNDRRGRGVSASGSKTKTLASSLTLLKAN